tara:strand:- start:104 stop:457 length:354 start_codon:yes stop_codon:yes gene_type:complete
MHRFFFLFFFLYSDTFIQAKSTNPLSGNKDAIEIGKSLYKSKCASCHGPLAQGLNNGRAVTPGLVEYKKGYTQFISILENGYYRMPAWGGKEKLKVLQINQLIAYLESISTKMANWQ